MAILKHFNVGYRSSNYYLLDAGSSNLAVDAGWPGTLNDYGRALRPTGKRVQDVDYLIVTHFHPDHAGLVQELKNQGVRFVVFDVQLGHVIPMERLIQKQMRYAPIRPEDNIVLSIPESRAFLAKIGLSGEALHTPGHTDDGISLVLDSGEVFVGDLPPESLAMENDTDLKKSWAKLRERGVRRVFPGHGKPYTL